MCSTIYIYVPELVDGGFRIPVAMEKRSAGRQKRWMMYGGRKEFGNSHRAFAVSKMKARMIARKIDKIRN
jgi:hypothetical protein